MQTTWDGKPLAQQPPTGVTIVVYCNVKKNIQFLLLHRAAFEMDFEGDWSWTPPAGGRQPGEQPDDCARRELLEETGLELEPERTGLGSKDWYIYKAEAPSDVSVQLLDREHDGYLWAPLSQALNLCKPAIVRRQIEVVASTLTDNGE